jgi:hypothetical protein
VRRTNEELKESAAAAVEKLLTKDLFRPDFEGQTRSGREAMQGVMAYLDMDVGDRPHSHSTWSVGSNRAVTSSTGADGSIPGTVDSGIMLEETEAEDIINSANEMMKPLHSNYHPLASVGTNLMQDTFMIKGLTQGRPLTVSALLIMKRYDLFRGLGLGEKEFVRWLMAVEQG